MNLKGLSCLEHLAIAETMTNLDATLEFQWGSTDIDPSCFGSLRQFAKILKKHPSLEVKIEGHCAIEAPSHIAVPFSTERAASVEHYLMSEGVREMCFVPVWSIACAHLCDLCSR